LFVRKKRTIWSALKQVLTLYQSKGHKIEEMEFSENEKVIHTILADNEFEALREEIEECGKKVNITAKEEHVSEVERQNCVIKERVRGIIQTLPYDMMRRKMKVALIHYVVYWLNMMPKDGQDFSPRELICGEQILDYKKKIVDCLLEHTLKSMMT
jgi:hypothetical protein